jgi:protein involved in polysaccharide export with SLBB domain
MIRFKFIICGIALSLFLNSCSMVIEPVSVFFSEQDIATKAEQEEFEINIKSLTFNSAKKANNAPYPRQLILTGIGSTANVLDETLFLKSSFPKKLSNPIYHLGIGDEISFTLLNEFKTGIAQWPNSPEEYEYLLGPGDKLSFAQSNDIKGDISISYNSNGQIVPNISDNKLITTQGVIGSDGNILLFGLGNILAANRTLDDVRTEVRNILIRNGLAPNFQLEIIEFESKSVHVTTGGGNSEIYFLNNIPITLTDVALRAGVSDQNQSFATVKLIRNAQKFRFTAGQLFNEKTPQIILQDNDQIEIQIADKVSKTNKSVVGSKGNILIESVGSILAVNRTLNDIHEEISNILTKKGIKPIFQLELTGFASKKAYFILKGQASTIVQLTDSKLSLRDLIIQSNKPPISKPSLSIVTLKRNGQVFRMTEEQILDPKTESIWIIDGDQIEMEILPYKPGKVFALSGAGNAKVVPIYPSNRETMADILFAKNGPLNIQSAKRSEVYLLRGKNPSVAYHLDAQNVSRVLVAAKTELRPNDIVYVAERPIISFSRTLSELLPLRILMRDIQNNNIP